MTSNEMREVLLASPLLEGMPAALCSELAEKFHPRPFKSGAMVMLEDQKGSIVGLIGSGTAKVSRSRPRSSTLLNVIGPGEVLGEISMVDGFGHTADIVTLEPLTLLWTSRDEFQEALDKHPLLFRNISRLLARRLRLASARLEAIASLDVPGRVAYQLLAFAGAYGQKTEQGTLIPLLVRQGDLAELIGATRTRVNQTLASMRRAGLVETLPQGHIVILDEEMLRKRFVIF